ncbi:MAG TPA: lysophospholipid acyltransferase family protein [Acidimicrobiales bacterium]|nr:lysophospholipid acyltransferase family protein [Acidimicrobiales bacterium]
MAYWVVKAVLTPVLRFLFRVRVEGAEHIPADGAAILASNHLSFSDSIFLPLVLRRRITFVAKAEYFDDPKTAWFFRAVGQIPIKREGGSASQGALDAATEVLEGGGLFGIYPEGTRSPDGRLYKGHTGVARLALRNRCPVLAVAMIGTREAQPIGQVKPNFFMPITVRISEPMSFERYDDRADDPRVLREITDQVMFELRELSGQEYVHQYAKRKDTEEGAAAAEPARIASVVAADGLAGTFDRVAAAG